MITAVLDSNVLLSGFLTGEAPPARIVDAWQTGRFELVVSEPILAELSATSRSPTSGVASPRHRSPKTSTAFAP